MRTKPSRIPHGVQKLVKPAKEAGLPVRLTSREAKIYESICIDSAPTPIEEIARLAYKDRKRPKNWRKSILVTMQRLISKTVSCDKTIKRHSQIGRGIPATYVATSGK